MEKNEKVEIKKDNEKVTRTKWHLTDTGILNQTFPSNKVKSFPMKDLYPNWDKFNDAQKRVAAAGVRETMSNSYAGKKTLALTEKDIIELVTKIWTRWTTEGKFYSGERANAAISKVDAFKEKVRAKAKELGISEEIAEKLLAV